MTKSMEIYFSDLNETAQKNLLKFVGAEHPSEMNWDMDICPIAIFEVEDEDEDKLEDQGESRG